MCGRAFGVNEKQLTHEECCLGERRSDLPDCDWRYQPAGPAFPDMMDFFRSEELWLRTYVIAWHIATENGYAEGELNYLAENGAARHALTEE